MDKKSEPSCQLLKMFMDSLYDIDILFSREEKIEASNNFQSRIYIMLSNFLIFSKIHLYKIKNS